MAYQPGQGAVVFCTSYADDLSVWKNRYRRWISAVRGSTLEWRQLVIVDDGSPVLPDWPDVTIVQEGGALPANGVILYHFQERLGRRGIRDYPGWYRSFTFMGRYAHEHHVPKIIHIESDAYLVSERLQNAFNAIQDGWASVWLEDYTMPESAIQIVAGNSIGCLAEWSAVPYAERQNQDIENIIPFTHLMKEFKGGRYGEVQDHVPPDADWTVQVYPPSWNNPDYFWWLPRSPRAETIS